MKRVLVTGYSGLIGHHVRSALEAANAQARFGGAAAPFEVRLAGRRELAADARLDELVEGVDDVIHLAGVNRPAEGESHAVNAELAERLSDSFERTGTVPHLVYANSIQSEESDGEYGRSKAAALAAFAAWGARRGGTVADFVLPHVFGEGGRPYHNSVTSTLCANAVDGVPSTVRTGAVVQLIHAGRVADAMLASLGRARTERVPLAGREITVAELDRRIVALRDSYRDGIVPDVSDAFDRELFNTYRWYEFPRRRPDPLPLRADSRGVLFEAVKGGGGGQTFLSWTEPGVTRGDHFHRRKVERFLVLEGEAVIRLRPVFGDEITEIAVGGDEPRYVDMPTLYTHSIENVGRSRLLTLFWAHEIFDPEDPDTYAAAVLGHGSRADAG